MITVHLPADLATKFQAQTETKLPASTLGALVEQLDGKWPGLKHWLVEVDGRFRPHLAVFVGEERYTRADASIGLAEGAEVWVIRAVSGG